MMTSIVLASLAFALLSAALNQTYPPPVSLSERDVGLLRRSVLPVHAVGMVATVGTFVALGTGLHRLTGRMEGPAFVGGAALLFLFLIDAWFALVLRWKGAEWWQAYRAYLSHQYGFDYVAGARIVQATAALLALVWIEYDLIV